MAIAPSKIRRTTGPRHSKYVGPMRPDIATLVENYRNLYPALDDETFERLTRGVLANDSLTVKIVLSARGNLLDGYHRCLILLNGDANHPPRKVLTPEDYTVDHTAVDELSEMKAHVGYQETRRQSSSADQAAMARSVMRRFGWSAGKFADEFGFKPVTVKAWLARNPDPAFDAEMALSGRLGKDGKVYNDVPEAPAAKRIRSHPTPGAAVVTTTNKYLAEITNPELVQWIADNVDAADRVEVAGKWARIAASAGEIANAAAVQPEGDDNPFDETTQGGSYDSSVPRTDDIAGSATRRTP